MSDFPFRFTSGEVGCPRCETVLQRGNAPFYIEGEYVGTFESLICLVCNFSALTQNGYEKAVLKAREFGLVGEAEVSDIPDIDEIELVVGRSGTGKNDQKIMQKDDEEETVPYLGEILQPYCLTIKCFTKKTRS